MKLQFIGATESVTGSKHLITTKNNIKILLDCGMFQGEKEVGNISNHQFGFDPMQVDFILLSHAHIDHSGLIPRMVRGNFRGRIFCTPATFDLCETMLMDSARIQENDADFINRKRKKEGQRNVEPLYTEADVKLALSLFKTIPYHKKTTLDEDLSFQFSDAGHILGSAAIHLDYAGKEGFMHLTYTSDIGRQYDKILPPPEPFRQADYIICESTYGDRLHGDSDDSLKELEQIILKTCVEKRGKVIIPAFSLDRTQELVYALDILKYSKRIPSIKVFVDSPLSVKTTEIMRNHMELFNDEIKAYMSKTDGDPFIFKDIKYISQVEDSKKLNSLEEPCIIISASGMAEAGRIKHHIKNNIEDQRNTILLVGYASPNSLAGKLKRKEPEVRIFGKFYRVNANIESLESYSAHADYAEIIEYLKCQNPTKVKCVYLVHGDEEAKINLQSILKQAGFKSVKLVTYKEEVILI
jgi:metallo-beta-lactamase family protein